MSSVIPFPFNAVELYAVTVNGKHWTRSKELCKALKYNKKTSKTANTIRAHCSRENYAHKYELTKVHAACTLLNWPSDSRKHDYYLNEEGMYELVFSSQQQKAKAFRKYCCNEMFPRIRKQLVDKMQEDHQKAIEDRDNRIQTIQHENVGLQGEIRNAGRTITDLIENRHVARCGEYDNILVGVKKNKPIEDDAKKSRHAFYMMRCQKRRKGFLMARLKKEYPYMSEKGTCEDPNAVHRWCGFKEDVLGEDNYYRNHFSLDTTTKSEFEELFEIYMD